MFIYSRLSLLPIALFFLLSLHASAFDDKNNSESKAINVKKLKENDDLVNWFQTSRSYNGGKWISRTVNFAFYHDYITMGNKKYEIESWDRTRRVNFFTMSDPLTKKIFYLIVDRKKCIATFYSETLYSAKTYYHISWVVK